MARSGRFGRLPRKAPDLSGAIVSLMNQYWNTQESNMVSAWQKGGEVDGQKVTDERLLAFWLQRRDSVSKDDPMWDYYDNQYSQYHFSIEESKIGLQYAQKKISARDVAKWYKGQAANYAPDSEIYRTIMGQAARFLDAARQKSKADATARRQKAYKSAWENAYKQDVLPSAYVTTGMTWAYRQLGLLSGSSTTDTTGDGSGDNTDAGPLLGGGADLTGLSYSTGTSQTVETMLAALSDPSNPMYDYFKKTFIDPAQRDGLDISLPLNQQDLEALLSRATTGYDNLIAINQRFHDVAPTSGAASTDNLRQNKIDTIDLFQNLFVSDELVTYSQRRAAFESAISAPGATVFDQAKAFTDYYNGLNSLKAQVGDQNPNMVAALDAEQRYLTGDSVGETPTIAEDALMAPFTSQGLSPTGANGDAANFSNMSKNIQDTITALSNGSAIAVVKDTNTGLWTAMNGDQLKANYGNDFVLIPQVANVTTFAPSADPTQRILGQGVQQNTVPLTYGQVVQASPIVVQAPASGTPDPDTGTINQPALGVLPGYSSTIGEVAYVPDATGTSTTPVYGIWVNGSMRWTTDSPFVPGSVAHMSVDPNSNQLMVTLDPSSPNIVVPNGNAAGTGPAYNPKGAIDQSIVAPGSTSTFVDPGIAVLASTDPGRREIAAMDPTQLMVTLQNSPWVNWNDPTQVNELWTDIGVIKKTVASTGVGDSAGYQAEYNFFQQLQNSRLPVGAAPDPMSVILQAGEANDPWAKGLGITSNPWSQILLRYSISARAGTLVDTSTYKNPFDPANIIHPPVASQYNSDNPPPPPVATMPPSQTDNQDTNARPFAPVPGAAPYGAPTINNSGQISIPNLPTPTPMPSPSPAPTMPNPAPSPNVVPNIPTPLPSNIPGYYGGIPTPKPPSSEPAPYEPDPGHVGMGGT